MPLIVLPEIFDLFLSMVCLTFESLARKPWERHDDNAEAPNDESAREDLQSSFEAFHSVRSLSAVNNSSIFILLFT